VPNSCLKVGADKRECIHFILGCLMDDHYVPKKTESQNSERRSNIVKFPFPAELHSEIERLYKSVFCSIFNVKKSVDPNTISAYVATSGSTADHIILFFSKGPSVIVINEIFTIPAKDLLMFVKNVFENMAYVKIVTFPSVRTNANVAGFPLQRFNATEDIVISLPLSIKEYSSSLGKSTRETINRYQRKIVTQYPSIEFVSLEGNTIAPSIVDSLVGLNCLRIRNKNQVPSHTAESIDWLRRIIQKFGVVILAKQHDRICGGVLCTNVNGKFFMHVVAHDSDFDSLRMGKVCCYLSICDAIRRGGSEYHMLSGEYDYKYKFLGKKFEFERISFYRSKTAVLSTLPFFMKMELKGRGRILKKTLRKYSKKLNSNFGPGREQK
jgi:hypothetical protein